jgi:hypothetical protein
MLFFNGDGVFVFRNSIDGSSQLDSDPVWLAMVVHVLWWQQEKSKKRRREKQRCKKKNKKRGGTNRSFSTATFQKLTSFF